MTEIFTYYDTSIVQSFVDAMTPEQRHELVTIPFGTDYRSMLHYRDLMELADTFVDGVKVTNTVALLRDGCTLLNNEDEDEH